MSDFKIVNNSFYSDSSDDLDHVYAAEYDLMMNIRRSRNKPVRAIPPHMFKPRVTDSDNMSAEADHDGQSQNDGHLVDISLR